MDEKYRRINIDNAAILIEKESSMLYAVSKDGIAKPILVNIPFSDAFGNLILDPELWHNYMHENGFEHSHGEECCECEGCSEPEDREE